MVRPAMAACLIGLVLTSLLVAACGSASPESNEAPTPAEAQEAATTAPEAEASEPTEADSEEAAAEAEEATSEESEASNDENLQAPDQALSSDGEATCATATPQNDPLVAALQPNDLIAAASETDWSKGPADAAITLIEYGDFQ